MASADLSAQKLRELLNYDPETGIFTRRIALCNAVKAGDVAGSNSNGYLALHVAGRRYKAHRLAWMYVYGDWPKSHIDHINGDKADNRITNLRDVDRSTNLQNMRLATKRNSVGLMGVYPVKGRYTSKIMVNGASRYLGCFKTAEEAHAAYLEAKREFHPGCTI
jgi:hypothetical protein